MRPRHVSNRDTIALNKLLRGAVLLLAPVAPAAALLDVASEPREARRRNEADSWTAR